MKAARAFLVAAALCGSAILIQAQQGPPPQFRAEVNYVEVDARVLDEQGKPIRGLTQRDFTVIEDGVRQTLTNFSVVDIPVSTAVAGPTTPAPVRPDVVSNTQGAKRSRTYLIVFDGPSVSFRWTNEVRAFLRRFIERSVGPDDLVGIATAGCDGAYENFTNDKSRLIAAVGRMVGQRERKCFDTLDDPTSRGVATARETDARRRQRQLVEIVHAMSAAGVGSKAIIYVSEGISFDPTITDTETLMLVGDAERVSTQARRSNVPIYPVDPRGLSSGFENAAEVPLVGLTADDPASTLLNEARRGQQSLRILADDSGGLPIVGVNDIDGAFDRIVAMSSSYYVLGYYSTNSRRDGKYRKIDVTVGRPGARVLNRRGYTAAVAGQPKTPALAGPPKSSIELREALNAVLPAAGLPLEMTVAAFRQMNNRASVAVVLETPGPDLAWRDEVLAAPLEMTAIAMEKRGGIKAGDVNRLQLSTKSDTADRVRRFGYRWLGRLDDLKPGRYQIRGAAANGSSKQGSVWYDLEIPDFWKNPLAMSDVMMTSAGAMYRPTQRPDKRLEDAMPGPPATLRQFPAGGSVAIYAEVYDNQLDRPHDIEWTVVVAGEHGDVMYQTAETHAAGELKESGGVVRVKVGIPLVKMPPGNYTLTVDAHQTVNRAISTGRAVPFQVLRASVR